MEGRKQGFGKMFWKDGDRYEDDRDRTLYMIRYRGDWEEDLPEGKGEYQVKERLFSLVYLISQWANGNKFVGQFRRGLPSGEVGRRGRQTSSLEL